MIRLLRPLFQRSDSRNRRVAFTALTLVGLVVALGLPSAALAGTAPTVSTSDTFSTGATTATVEGVINPGNDSTSYAVQWDVASSTWCTSGGSSGSPANTTNAPNPVGPDNNFDFVSVDLTTPPLTGGTDYCAELTATNADGGPVDGGQVSWTQGLPEAITFRTFSTAGTAATVEGAVDTAGQNDATYQVQYDQAGSPWCQSFGTSGSPAGTTSPQPLAVSDSEFHDVSVELPDVSLSLTEKSDYCAQLVVTNGSGDGAGGTVSWTQGAPTVDTNTADATGAATATLTGDVNPAGLDTSYEAEFAVASSDWCTSGGTSGPAQHTALVDLGFTNGAFHDVSVNLTGLNPSTDYCGEIVATNVDGLAESFQLSWSQPETPKNTLTVSRAGTGSGTVTSSPAGINCGATCSAKFNAGTQVTLTAAAASGSTFSGWSGGGCSGASTCKVTLDANTAVTATFTTAFVPTLTVSPAGTGLGHVASSPAGIDCGTACTQAFALGTQVTLTATADSGSTFTGWSGGGCSGTGTCVVTLNSDTTVTATFSANPPPPPPVTKCIVPKLKGKTLAAAKRSIKSHHCSVGKITKVISSPKNKGHVISQSPKPGKHLRKGSKVALKVGK